MLEPLQFGVPEGDAAVTLFNNVAGRRTITDPHRLADVTGMAETAFPATSRYTKLIEKPPVAQGHVGDQERGVIEL